MKHLVTSVILISLAPQSCFAAGDQPLIVSRVESPSKTFESLIEESAPEAFTSGKYRVYIVRRGETRPRNGCEVALFSGPMRNEHAFGVDSKWIGEHTLQISYLKTRIAEVQPTVEFDNQRFKIAVLSNVANDTAGTGSMAAGIMRALSASHLGDHVPLPAQFDPIVRRDLRSHFSRQFHGDVTVQYVLLDKSPSQSGVSYPHFYAWVDVYQGRTVQFSGAVRLNAVNRKQFVVNGQQDAASILVNKLETESLFPKSLWSKIRTRAATRINQKSEGFRHQTRITSSSY